jgi:hypothetical protein
MLVAKLAAALAARPATTNVTLLSGVYLDGAAAGPSVFRLASLRTRGAARLEARALACGIVRRLSRATKEIQHAAPS